jgi:hypothetical protein
MIVTKMLLAILLAACFLVMLGCAPPSPWDSGGEMDLKAKAITKEYDDKMSAENDRVIAEAEKLLQPPRIHKRTDKICAKHPSWGEGVCLKVAEGNTWVGMDIDMLHDSIGLPDHVNQTYLSEGSVSSQLVYESPQAYIYVGKDGIVTAIQISR